MSDYGNAAEERWNSDEPCDASATRQSITSSPITAWCEEKGRNVNLAVEDELPKVSWPVCAVSSDGNIMEPLPRDLMGTERTLDDTDKRERHSDKLNIHLIGFTVRKSTLLTLTLIGLGIVLGT